MRRTIGVREFAAGTRRIPRHARERRDAVDITYRGQVMARVVPVPPQAEGDDTPSAIWTDMDRLAAEIGRHWKPGGKSGAEPASGGVEGDRRAC